ncbi:MFS transporter [Celeribacter indicus]|uniref:Permease n=1 Tax=Celeribacter indicus TaxID=1208324 RepID=A0A0B5E5F5_9RHOB|nr:MFS transporter [Celeribacter indicus]AJE47582.1 permease [Celeribacter indicus]SDW10942.1 Predicted arabinose efflux permease, MFS family [Celeribacter indicus]
MTDGSRPGATLATLFARGTPRLLAAALLAIFMAALEQTIMGPVLGRIIAELGDGPLVPWLTTGFLLAATVAAPLYGAIADIRGRRSALLLASACFVFGSLLCALSFRLEMLLVARVVQGAGAGGLMSLPFVIVADRVPMRNRAVFSAYISTIFAAAGLLGPVVGGAIAEWLDWRWVFWFNLPLGALVILGVMTAVTSRAPLKGRRLDLRGGLYLLCAATPTILLLERAGEGGPGGLLLAVTAALFWVVFVRHLLSQADPLVPLPVLRDPSIFLAALGLAMTQGTNLGLAVYLPIYFQKVHGLDPGAAGVALLAFVGAIMAGAYVPPRLLRANPAYKPLMVGCAALTFGFAVAFWLCTLFDLPFAVVILSNIGLGIGIGLLYPVYTLIVQNAAPSEQMGAAMGVLAFLRAMGGTLGVSLAGIGALRAGLLSEGGAGAGHGVFGVVAPLLMAVCLLAAVFLPARRLEGFGREA